ncbi:phospholipid-transporting ATPase ABCA3-like [Babylonia areolata]|uniref:phospholipid-transporting ATPase ABCA3-like n=1 Tax=Babylonia areolata TaxID=304850 RepID=UPI003FD5F40D
MAGFFKQLKLLLWKNLLLYIRRPCTLVFEIGFPVFFACLMLVIRTLIERKTVDTSTYYSNVDLHPSSLYPSSLEVGYVPNATVVQTVMADVVGKINSYTSGVSATGVGFASESDLVTYYRANTGTLRLAVVFPGLTTASTSLPSSLAYRVRPATNDSQRWVSTRTYPFYQTSAPRDNAEDPDYIDTGAAYLLSLVGEAVIRQWNGGGSTPIFEMHAERMPYPPYYEDNMITVIQTQLPLFLMLSFILTVIQTTKVIVMEKEKRIKESMKLMGLKPAAHWTSWFLTTFLYLILALAIYAILFGVKINDTVGAVLANSDISLFYVFLLFYAMAMITFCFMISVIAKKANVGAAIAGILFFGFYFPYLFITYEDMTETSKLGLCLLFNMAMAFGANLFGLYEGTGTGATWSNFTETATVDDNFTLLQAMIMLLVDSLLHVLVTWYVENVWPGDYGVPRPFYFCFTKSYWCGGRTRSDASYDSSNTDLQHFESDPENLKAGIQICNLTKRYSKGKTAVDNLSLKMYEGQITVLLGHNGAGKTTTMSMLTGFIPPSGGTALVNGHDICEDIDGVRKSLGLCPQHNILWDTLTVTEHLDFFAQLKGSDSSNVKREVEEMTKEVGLEFKAKTKAGNLSGGQKRKLSVGIALISGSKVVVLDEPSSGMDPAARRQTWELLQRQRAGRTILLTTHYMDEADVLGDRIAIMSQGVVRCCGSSLFLKKLFGAGYHLVAVKDKGCQVPALTDAIRERIPSAQFEEEINAEVSYLLPDDQSAAFPGLFRFLEEHRAELGIVGFGTSATTMEEVFLKVGEDADDDIANLGGSGRPGSAKRPHTRDGFTNKAMNLDDEKPLVASSSSSSIHTSNGKSSKAKEAVVEEDILAFNRSYTKVTGLSLRWSQFYGMFVKKVLLSWRHRIISVVQLLLPVIFTILALLIDTESVNEEAVLDFNLSPFGTTYVAYSNGSAPTAGTENAASVYAGTLSSESLRQVDVASAYTNMSEYLLSLATSLTTSVYNKEVIIGAQFDPPATGGNTLKATAFYNGQPFHALPVAVSAMLNGLAKAYASSSHSLTTSMEPLPKGEDAAAEDSSTTSATQGFLTGFCISFGMAFLTSSFVFFLVKEREVGAKHLQVVSGVGPGMFWLATFLWDYVNYLLPTFAMLIVFAAFDTSAYVDGQRLSLVLLVLLLYGWAALAFVYVVSFLFKSPATAMVLLIVFNILTGLVTTITVFILALPGLDLTTEADLLEWVFLVIFPNYCMAKAFMDIYTNYLNIDTCQKLLYTATCPVQPGPCCQDYGTCTSSYCIEFQTDYLAWESPGIGRFLLFMFLQGLVFMAIVLATDFSLFARLKAYLKGGQRQRKTSDVPMAFVNGVGVSSDDMMEDSDVAAERSRLYQQRQQGGGSRGDVTRSDPLVIMDLHKRYGSFTAVSNICVGVPQQECFGLLGQNGAGKTTTFKMLTGDVSVTSGNAYLKGYDVINQIKEVQQNMGYCPQFDALLDTMTGRETLQMYARLRGVPSQHIETVVDKLIDIMMLEPHKDKQAGYYSGGNKRKLSTAIALVGDPPFLLLDEPSAGVDPAARRQLWNVLSRVRASGRTLVLTSHSMEECDALCTRIAIMVNGVFKCLGSPQHLKNKFGQGYTLVVKMGLREDGLLAPTQPVVDVVQANFRGASVFDGMQGFVHFQVPDESAHVADVFSLMERAKMELQVEDYSVHQTTLEQVFLTFTRKQAPPKDSPGHSIMEQVCCCCCMQLGVYGKKKSSGQD